MLVEAMADCYTGIEVIAVHVFLQTVQIQVEEKEDDTEESSSKEGWAPREQLPADGRACASCLLSHRIKLQECVGVLSASLMDQ